MKELSRTPRKYLFWGKERYCSARCGGHCTREAHTRAVDDGKSLVKLLGKGWKSVVHENLGWHFYAVHSKTKATMHIHGARAFWVQVMVGNQQAHITEPTALHALNSLKGMLTGLSLSFAATRNMLDG